MLRESLLLKALGASSCNLGPSLLPSPVVETEYQNCRHFSRFRPTSDCSGAAHFLEWGWRSVPEVLTSSYWRIISEIGKLNKGKILHLFVNVKTGFLYKIGFCIVIIIFASPLLQLLREEGSTDNETTPLFRSYSEMVTKVAGILYGERENITSFLLICPLLIQQTDASDRNTAVKVTKVSIIDSAGKPKSVTSL